MRRLAKIINILMLAVYLVHFAGTTFFIHQHHLQNRTIVHSHPYKDPQHSHSSTQLQLISMLQDRTSTEAVDFRAPECAQIQYYAISTIVPFRSSVVSIAAVPQLRAPPAC